MLHTLVADSAHPWETNEKKQYWYCLELSEHAWSAWLDTHAQ